tara:strand:- start:2668 stop:2961 length:294 start_codon:yes stop_codon:yes gene_type:complete
MGRILRYTLADNTVSGVDFGFRTAGKLLIRNAGSNDVFIGYDPSDVKGGTNYFTIEPGIVYTFDMGSDVGFLSQNQQLYLNCPTGTNVMEIWFANEV